ncbi:nucleolar protein 14 isoform X2 [Benincasa hispida]|uniref:nucleolar protein 14 isoform X2 n=1 Tax=Benincasa hispida TaxID=102211 RepID=UPI001900522F|nr:nucleolar protein 14 isoform X2 [Benincasa hispida]
MAKLSIRSSSNNDKKTKKKKKKISGPKALTMKVTAPKTNPFESIWSRRKFDVLGKKRKGEERRIGLARSLAIEKRKKTLLKEYEQSRKSTEFSDKRIGEWDEELGEFDKAILRSQRELKRKLNKSGKYNLSDGEEDDYFGIQNLGSLPANDDFEDEIMPDDDDDDDAAAGEPKKGAYRDAVHQQKGPSLEGEENKRKSKKEVMDEVIAKSKFFKAQKAKDKEENEQLVEELDKKFESLVQSEALLSLTGSGNALKALVQKSISNEHLKKDNLSAAGKTENFNQEKPDAFDRLVKEMAMEIRARPSDRTKTPEEIAQEERERLELLEEERQKRMLAPDNSSDEEDDDAENASVGKQKYISGDDLGDSFTLDDERSHKKGWVDEILGRKDADGTESEDDDSAEDSDNSQDDADGDSDDESEEDDSTHGLKHSLKDWEQSDDDIIDTDSDEDDEASKGRNGPDEEHSKEKVDHEGPKKAYKSSIAKSSKSDGISEDAKKLERDIQRQSKPELPYIIDAPESYDQFLSLLANCSNSDVILIIARIRGSNAIQLTDKNLEKMQRFYGILLQYFAVSANKKPLNVELLNLLFKPLMEMSMEIPFYAATCARMRISRTHQQFCVQNKNPENSSWPSSKTLILLRLWSMIFPCSDYNHVVITPTILLMCEYLMRCPIVTGRDLATGAFLCSLLLYVARQSSKFCPEAINFLRTLLAAAVSRSSSSQNPQICHLVDLQALGQLLRIQNPTNEITPLNFFFIMDLTDDSSVFSSDNFRAGLLSTVTETLYGFVNIYGQLKTFPEIFLPISTILHELAQQENMPDVLQDKFRKVAKAIEAKTEEHYTGRQPLRMRKQKAVPIKLLNPKFEENFVRGRDYDPDRERAERRKMQKLLKRETKGAVRELRKDNHFLSEVKARDKALQEEERAEKYKKARTFLEAQEHAFKSGQLGNGRKRRK